MITRALIRKVVIRINIVLALALALSVVYVWTLDVDPTPSVPQAEPAPLTPEEVTTEYHRLLDERNNAMRELNEIMELRNLYLEGKLHSS